MWPVTASWLAALSQPHGRYTRMEAWYAGAKVTNVAVESGNVKVDASRSIRRSLTADVPESYWPTSTSSTLAPYGARLKIFQGITGSNGNLIAPEVPVFAGRVETLQRERLSGKVTITASDPMADVKDAQFEQPRTAVAGTSVVGNIMSLIAEVRTDADFVDLTGSPAVMPVTMMWDTDRGQAVDDLAASIGAEVFFLPDGVTCLIQPIPRLGGTSVWTLVQGQNSTIVKDVTSRSRFDVANRIIVQVEQPGQSPILVTVTDDFPGSATRYGGPYGTVVRTYSNQLITSVGQAQAAGLARLSRSIGATRTRDLDTVPNSALEGGDLITVTTNEGTEQHIADAFEVPLAAADVMTINTRSTLNSVS